MLPLLGIVTSQVRSMLFLCYGLDNRSSTILQARDVLRHRIRKIWVAILYAKLLYSNCSGGQSDLLGRAY